MISMFLLPITIISIYYTHIVCFVRAAVKRARKTNALPVRRFNLKREIQIKHRFSNTKDIKVFRHIIILITVLCIGGFPYSMLMIFNVQSIAPFSMYRLCITVFALSVTVDMGAIFFLTKILSEVFRFIIILVKLSETFGNIRFALVAVYGQYRQIFSLNTEHLNEHENNTGE
ncbi:unnamed protein product [Rotaria socialis]